MKNKFKKGITLLVSIIVTSMLLIVSFVVTNIAFRQVIIANAGEESQYAFYNADSGTECAIYWDLKNTGGSAFSTTTANSISCNGQNISAASPAVPTIPSQPTRVGGGGNGSPTSIFSFTFPRGCVIVSVNKAYVSNSLITTIVSRGYNTCDTSAIRRYERGITLTY